MKTVINIKTDREVKEAAKKLAHELGIPLSTIINAQLKEFVRAKSLHLSTSKRMSPYLEALLGQTEKDIKQKMRISLPFASADEMDRYLDA